MIKRNICLTCICAAVLLCGCTIQKNRTDKLRDLTFTVLREDEIPEELSVQIEVQKENPFWLTYEDQGWLYVARGYGEQETSGYSIAADAFYETENTICIHTEFRGPEKGEDIKDGKTYPYIVIKTEFIDKYVVFQ